MTPIYYVICVLLGCLVLSVGLMIYGAIVLDFNFIGVSMFLDIIVFAMALRALLVFDELFA